MYSTIENKSKPFSQLENPSPQRDQFFALRNLTQHLTCGSQSQRAQVPLIRPQNILKKKKKIKVTRNWV